MGALGLVVQIEPMYPTKKACHLDRPLRRQGEWRELRRFVCLRGGRSLGCARDDKGSGFAVDIEIEQK